jgi:hypothetical protein
VIPTEEVEGVGAVAEDVPPEGAVYQLRVLPAVGFAERAVGVAS